MGVTGAQIKVLEVNKLDAQGVTGYLHNIQVTCLLNNGGSIGGGGFIAYATTDNIWNDDYVITAKGGNYGDTVNLVVRRRITENNDVPLGNDGTIYIWVESTDVATVVATEFRIVTETWGNFIGVTEL